MSCMSFSTPSLKPSFILKASWLLTFLPGETIGTCFSVLWNPTESKPFAELSLSNPHFPGEGQERQDPVCIRSMGRLLCILTSPPVKWAHAGPIVREHEAQLGRHTGAHRVSSYLPPALSLSSLRCFLMWICNWICYNIAYFVFFGIFWPWAMWDLRSPTRDQTHTPCLNPWTAREVPLFFSLRAFKGWTRLPQD